MLNLAPANTAVVGSATGRTSPLTHRQIDAELIIGQTEPIMPSFLAKLRILGATSKKVLKRLSKLDDRHLRRVLGDFQHPMELLALDAVELAAQCHLRRLGQRRIGFARLVLPLSLGYKHGIKHL